jgi:iron complex transport system ATP-binding protein
MSAPRNAVEVKGLSVSFDGPRVLRHVFLSVPEGAWVTLIGPNGAGKSTLLRSVAGLVDHTGEIFLAGKSMLELSRRDIARTVAFVPQRPFLPQAMSIFDYVLMGRSPYISYLGSETHQDVAIVRAVMARLELEDLAERPLGSLSGGEAQRAVLARALAQEAPVMLLDEPTSALDVGHSQQVLELVDALRADHKLTVISAMHDLTLAGQFADSLVLLAEGIGVASGPASTVLTERTIREHYGASVRVVHEEGCVLVLPTRQSAAQKAIVQR